MRQPSRSYTSTSTPPSIRAPLSARNGIVDTTVVVRARFTTVMFSNRRRIRVPVNRASYVRVPVTFRSRWLLRAFRNALVSTTTRPLPFARIQLFIVRILARGEVGRGCTPLYNGHGHFLLFCFESPTMYGLSSCPLFVHGTTKTKFGARTFLRA